MSSAAAIPEPSGVSAPLATISHDNLGALIAILTAFGLSLVFVSFAIRAAARSKIGSYKTDDYMFIAAILFSILQASCVFFGLSKGLGKASYLINPNNTIALQKAVWLGDLGLIVALLCSKLSTAYLLLRLTPGRRHIVALWSCIALIAIWAFTSILLLAFRCHPQHPWTDAFSSSNCSNLIHEWQFISSLDSLTEVSLIMMSVYLVWDLKMARKSKAIVVSAFACRFPVIVVAFLRLHFLDISLKSTKPTFTCSVAICCGQLQISYSIFASMVPCLKTFMAPYEASSSSIPTIYTGTNPKFSSTMASRHLDDEQDKGARKGGSKLERLRPDGMIYEAKVTHDGETQRGSLESGDSQRMIIKKGIEWSVDYGNGIEGFSDKGSRRLRNPVAMDRRD